MMVSMLCLDKKPDGMYFKYKQDGFNEKNNNYIHKHSGNECRPLICSF